MNEDQQHQAEPDSAEKSSAGGHPAGTPKMRPAHRKARPAHGGNGPAWVALAVAVGLGLAGGYAWQRLDAALDGLMLQLAGSQTRVERVEERTDDVAGREGRIDSALAGLRTEQQDTRRRVEEVATALAQIQDRVASGERSLKIAEVLHLQRIASERLRLADDPEGALAALSTADAVLAELSDPRLMPVREQLAVEITALRAVERPDFAGTAQRIQQLISSLDALPARRTEVAAGASTPDAAVAATWWSRVLDELSRHVTIRRQARASRADAETALYLRRLIALRLEEARVALLRRDGVEYMSALQSALELLDGRFEPEAESRLRADIEALRAMRLSPDRPDISGSYERLLAVARPASRAE